MMRPVVCLLILIYGVACDVNFLYDAEQCLGQLVEYQCTVTGSATLRWRIVDKGIQMGSSQVYTDDPNPETPTTMGGGEFTVERLDNSPIISNISFTVQSSINGYTIQCEGGEETEQFNISIISLPVPNDISVFFNGKLMLIEWTVPTFSSQCFSIANYTVNSNTTNSRITTTDTSVTIPLEGLSAGVYCVSVAAVDTANTTGNYSEEKYFKLSVPQPPNITITFNEDGQDIYTVSLVFNHLNMPPVIGAYILFQPNTINKSLLYRNSQYDNTNFTYAVTLQFLTSYIVMAYGRNALGNGSTTTVTYTTPPFSISTSSAVSNSVSFVDPSSTDFSNLRDNNVVIGVTIGVFVGCLVIIGIIVIIVVVFFCLVVQRQKRQSESISVAYNPNSSDGTVQIKGNADIKDELDKPTPIGTENTNKAADDKPLIKKVVERIENMVYTDEKEQTEYLDDLLGSQVLVTQILGCTKELPVTTKKKKPALEESLSGNSCKIKVTSNEDSPQSFTVISSYDCVTDSANLETACRLTPLSIINMTNTHSHSSIVSSRPTANPKPSKVVSTCGCTTDENYNAKKPTQLKPQNNCITNNTQNTNPFHHDPDHSDPQNTASTNKYLIDTDQQQPEPTSHSHPYIVRSEYSCVNQEYTADFTNKPPYPSPRPKQFAPKIHNPQRVSMHKSSYIANSSTKQSTYLNQQNIISSYSCVTNI